MVENQVGNHSPKGWIKKGLLLIAVLCVGTLAKSQEVQRVFPSFSMNGDPLELALTGGMDNPQFSTVDLNNDNIQDLFIFDRNGNVPLTFLNDGTPGTSAYRFAPEYIDNFPAFTNWMLLRDLNCDGIQDIFGYSQTPGIPGVEVHRGYYDQNNEIAFEKITFWNYTFDLLWYPNINNFQSNLFVRNIDIPDCVDVDNDGDMDVLTFDDSGGYIQYFENQSADMGFGCDSLIMRLVDDCWGRFVESGVTGEIILSPSEDSCINRSTFIGGLSPSLHVGSTLLALDMDNDLDKDILVGDASQPNYTLITNGLHPDTAWMTGFDDQFPSYDISVNLVEYVAGFHLDVDNDGLKDLITAPNERLASENYFCSWYFKNTSSNETPLFDFQQDDFLINEMIDLGSGSAPVFFDHNGDGLLDIVVGTRGFFPRNGTLDPRLFLFENIGTLTQPAFSLVDEDYASVSSLGFNRLTPAFGDLDGDDDKDMLIGEAFGTLIYLENLDTGNGMAVFSNSVINYMSIDVGDQSAPFIFDLNDDQLPDLIVGEEQGNLNYFENTGTANNPSFTLVNNFLGEVDTREIGFLNGSSQPVFLEEDGNIILYTGSDPGSIDLYSEIEGNLAAGAFVQETNTYGNIFDGRSARISIADINDDDQLDFVVGNLRGGLTFYSEGDFITSIEAPVNDTPLPDFLIQPNPARQQVLLELENELESEVFIRVFDTLGRLQIQRESTLPTILSVGQLSAGLYFISLEINGFQKVKRLVVQ